MDIYLEQWLVVVTGDNECKKQVEDWVTGILYVFAEVTA
jgi:hypothetical protein